MFPGNDVRPSDETVDHVLRFKVCILLFGVSPAGCRTRNSAGFRSLLAKGEEAFFLFLRGAHGLCKELIFFRPCIGGSLFCRFLLAVFEFESSQTQGIVLFPDCSVRRGLGSSHFLNSGVRRGRGLRLKSSCLGDHDLNKIGQDREGIR